MSFEEVLHNGEAIILIVDACRSLVTLEVLSVMYNGAPYWRDLRSTKAPKASNPRISSLMTTMTHLPAKVRNVTSALHISQFMSFHGEQTLSIKSEPSLALMFSKSHNWTRWGWSLKWCPFGLSSKWLPALGANVKGISGIRRLFQKNWIWFPAKQCTFSGKVKKRKSVPCFRQIFLL